MPISKAQVSAFVTKLAQATLEEEDLIEQADRLNLDGGGTSVVQELARQILVAEKVRSRLANYKESGHFQTRAVTPVRGNVLSVLAVTRTSIAYFLERDGESSWRLLNLRSQLRLLMAKLEILDDLLENNCSP